MNHIPQAATWNAQATVSMPNPLGIVVIAVVLGAGLLVACMITMRRRGQLSTVATAVRPPSSTEARPGDPATAPPPSGESTPLAEPDDTRYCYVVSAAYGGVGLTGPGAEPAARAALSLFIADQHASIANNTIVTTKGLLRRLGGDALAFARIPKLHVCEDERHLREVVSGEFMSRVDKPKPDRPVVVFTESSIADEELRVVLDQGRHYGIGGIVIGEWPRRYVISVDGHLSFGGPTQCGVLDESAFNANLATLARAAAVEKTNQSQKKTDPASQHRDRVSHMRPPVVPGARPAPRRGRNTDSRKATETGLWLKLLGGVDMRFCGESVRFSRVTSYELLALLGADVAGADRTWLAQRLLPGVAEESAYGQLARIVASTRSDLRHLTGHPDEPFVTRTGERWKLDRDWIATDLAQFNAALAAADAAAEPDERAAYLKQAIALYQGPFAAGLLPATPWVEPLRTGYQSAAHTACLSLSEHYDRQGNLFAAADALERATDIDPDTETAYTKLIDLYRLRNDRTSVTRIEQKLKERR